MLRLLGFRVRLDSLNRDRADQRDDDRDRSRQQVRVAKADIEADVLQALENRNQRNRECGEKDINRNVSLGVRQWIVAAQDQLEHTLVDEVGDETGRQRRDDPTHDNHTDLSPLHGVDTDADRRKTDNRTDDRMRRGYRPSLVRSDEQPRTGGKQCCQHAVDQQLRSCREQFDINNALANRRCDLTACQHGAKKFKNGRNKNRLLDRQRFRADGCRHGVRDIIRANSPGHKDAEQGRKDDVDRSCFH